MKPGQQLIRWMDSDTTRPTYSGHRPHIQRPRPRPRTAVRDGGLTVTAVTGGRRAMRGLPTLEGGRV